MGVYPKPTPTERLDRSTVKGRTARGESNGACTYPERRPSGEKNGNHKLTADDVKMIRTLRSEGWLLRELGERFGASTSSVSYIVRGDHWKEQRCD